MTMQLMPVYFTTTTTKKNKKIKYASSAQKQNAIALQAEWEKIVANHAPKKAVRTIKRKVYMPPTVARRETPRYPSVDTGGSATKPINHDKVYTGDKMIGIATLHKSNAVPVFSSESAHDISKMRR